MTRLDIWLVNHGYFSSRQIAKRAIQLGAVLLNGRTAKPASKVRTDTVVELSETYLDRPFGYYKLLEIDSMLDKPLIEHGFRVLDIGSSAGGFLWYVHENGGVVTGIEVSQNFLKKLYDLLEILPRAKIVAADAFHVIPELIARPQSLDLLLIDVTTDCNGSLVLLNKFHHLLKPSGRALVAFKAMPNSTIITSMLHRISTMGFATQPIVLSYNRKEFHILARFCR